MTTLNFKNVLSILATLKSGARHLTMRNAIEILLISLVMSATACGNLDKKDEQEKIDEPANENVQTEITDERTKEATPLLTPKPQTSPTPKVVQRTRELVILSDRCQALRGHKSFSKEFNQYTCDCYGDRVLNLDKSEQKNVKVLDATFSDCRKESLAFIMNDSNRYLSIPKVGLEFENSAGSRYSNLLPSSDWTLSGVKIALNRKSEIIRVDSLSIKTSPDSVDGPCEWKYTFVDGKV